MAWIKVTPETMPPDMEPVFITVRSKRDHDFKDVMKDVFWNETERCWRWSDGNGDLAVLDNCMEVTHWMAYPKPA